MTDFKNKVIWITGASSGIGAALARKLAGEKALLILTSRNINKLELVKVDCKETVCNLLPADLTNFDSAKLTEQAISAFGHIDMVVHCAGLSQRSIAEETSLSVYRSLMEINFFGPVSITRNLLPYFRKRTNSNIVIIGSMAGLMGFPGRTGYAAAKHALKGFFETLQTEHTIQGLVITMVHPGRINTPISLAALTGTGSSYGKMDEGQLRGIPVEKCAAKVLAAVKRKKKNLIIARNERILFWLWWFVPRLYYKIARKAGEHNFQSIETTSSN